ncbi:hypothetical protein D7X30_23050 [Corallococcus sp. AB011P]|uniref:hypothetical protein n=1 Tax=unclassified Corallococcus TaxID=2685029 RepID=UPI000EA105A8|nr:MULTISPECIES: hypothetical protein [unclassified Corallococcus]RKG56453.1 hypothetical protein D7X30_23050 [Corallococcus sp. AB011P]RKH91506.1 hypothetical protein D7Y21_02755 [Corallococcus sp. AB045]
MTVAVLRAQAPEFDVASVLDRFPDCHPDAVWLQGEQLQRQGRHSTSGFNLTLVEDGEGTLHGPVAAARRQLEVLAPLLAELRQQAVPCVVDFGLFVGTARHFTSSIHFPPDDVRWFADQGIALAVSAYPTAEEELEDSSGNLQ